MKKYLSGLPILVVSLVLGLAMATSVLAAENSMPSLSDVLSQIQQSQNVTAINQLTCSKVTDDQFERLGDAVMETLHPGQAHEYMDQMMGGEGSTSLLLMHIRMGQQYLGCASSYGSYTSGYGMMGGMMGGYGMMGYGPMSGLGWTMGKNGAYYPPQSAGGLPVMMGGYYTNYPWFIMVTWILLWLLLALGIAVAVKWLRKK